MAAPIRLFQNFNLVADIADRSREISFTQDWAGILIQTTAVSGTDATAVVRIQWSDDGLAPWVDSSIIATITAPGTYIKSVPIQACFWRLRAVVTGTEPVLTCSATALV